MSYKNQDLLDVIVAIARSADPRHISAEYKKAIEEADAELEAEFKDEPYGTKDDYDAAEADDKYSNRGL